MRVVLMTIWLKCILRFFQLARGWHPFRVTMPMRHFSSIIAPFRLWCIVYTLNIWSIWLLLPINPWNQHGTCIDEQIETSSVNHHYDDRYCFLNLVVSFQATTVVYCNNCVFYYTYVRKHVSVLK